MTWEDKLKFDKALDIRKEYEAKGCHAVHNTTCTFMPLRCGDAMSGYILGEFGNLIAGDQRSSLAQHDAGTALFTYVKSVNLFPEIKHSVEEIFVSGYTDTRYFVPGSVDRGATSPPTTRGTPCSPPT